MRLVINAVSIAPGGGLSVLLGLLEAWREINANLEIVVVASKPPTIDALEKTAWADRVEKVLPCAPAWRHGAWQLTRMGGWSTRFAPDILLSNNVYVGQAPCPQVVHHQNLWTLFSRSYLPYARDGVRLLIQAYASRTALKRADANTFVSHFLREKAEVICPPSKSRNHVIYNGVSTRMLKSAPARCARRRVEGKIAAIQAPSPHKDNESLLQMLVELCREPDEPKWTLDVAGPGDWSPWQSRARQLGIQDRVRFIGACDAKQVQDLLLRSECLVFASCFEAFGLPVIEAMSCGCPVIAVNATAIPEVAGSAALLVPPHSPQQLAEGVRMLRVDDTVRRRLIEQGYERSKLFLWNDSARVFMKLFESAVSGARPLTEV